MELRTLKMAFWVTFDHVGMMLVVNFLGMALILPASCLGYWTLAVGGWSAFLWVGVPVLLLGWAVCLPIWAAAVAHMLKECLDTREGSLRTFLEGLRLFSGVASRLGLMLAGILVLLAANVWFYAVKVGQSVPWVGYGLSAVALWAWVVVVLATVFAFPALVQKRAGAWATVKLSLLLVLDNPVFSVFVALGVVMCMAFGVFPPALLLFSIAPGVVWVSCAYEMLSRKYASIEAQRADEAAGALHRTWRQRLVDWDAKDDYLNRGFRDLLFPWRQ